MDAKYSLLVNILRRRRRGQQQGQFEGHGISSPYFSLNGDVCIKLHHRRRGRTQGVTPLSGCQPLRSLVRGDGPTAPGPSTSESPSTSRPDEQRPADAVPVPGGQGASDAVSVRHGCRISRPTRSRIFGYPVFSLLQARPDEGRPQRHSTTTTPTGCSAGPLSSTSHPQIDGSRNPQRTNGSAGIREGLGRQGVG